MRRLPEGRAKIREQLVAHRRVASDLYQLQRLSFQAFHGYPRKLHNSWKCVRNPDRHNPRAQPDNCRL